MTKLISMSNYKNGSGKSAITAVLAEQLIKQNLKILILENKKNNMKVYTVEAFNTSDIKPYIDSNMINSTIIEKAIKEIKKNLYYLSGGQTLLNFKEIELVKDCNVFDYILLDSDLQDTEEADININVINPNYGEYTKIKDKINNKENKYILINKYSDEIVFISDKTEKYYFYFSPEIINFTNGYELKLTLQNEKEINKLIEKITGHKIKISKNNMFNIFKRKEKINGV